MELHHFFNSTESFVLSTIVEPKKQIVPPWWNRTIFSGFTMVEPDHYYGFTMVEPDHFFGFTMVEMKKMLHFHHAGSEKTVQFHVNSENKKVE